MLTVENFKMAVKMCDLGINHEETQKAHNMQIFINYLLIK